MQRNTPPPEISSPPLRLKMKSKKVEECDGSDQFQEERKGQLCFVTLVRLLLTRARPDPCFLSLKLNQMMSSGSVRKAFK